VRYAYKALADQKTVELDIFDDISASQWREDAVSAKSVRSQLKAAKGADLTIRINSRGGDVIEGLAIYNQLRQHEGHITAHVTGLAASMASVIAMAADELVMPKSAFLMIHNPFAGAVGDAEDLRSVADSLDAMQATLLDAYHEKTGLPKDEIQAMMDKETWLNGAKALKLRFADRLEKQARAKAEVRYLASLDGLDQLPDEVRQSVLLSGYAKVAEVVVAANSDPPEEDGMTAEEMKALLDAALAPLSARLEKLETPAARAAVATPAVSSDDKAALELELARDSALDAAVSAGKIANTDADRARFVARAKSPEALAVLVAHYEAAAPIVSTAALKLAPVATVDGSGPVISDATKKLCKKFGWDAKALFEKEV
jgi:ATP-dependent protease ClpP protease subunit